MIGQIAPSKNILEALKALHICLQEGFMFCFSIVGKAEDLDYLSSLKDYIRENSMEEYVTFKGPTNNPFKFFRENHVLLMCSNKEAFGRVTVEALKSGIPVIGSNTGGTLEIIDDGINGYFYQSGDPADLAKKIIQLSNQYAHFNHNQIARLAGDRFNEKNTLNQLCEVFN